MQGCQLLRSPLQYYLQKSNINFSTPNTIPTDKGPMQWHPHLFKFGPAGRRSISLFSFVLSRQLTRKNQQATAKATSPTFSAAGQYTATIIRDFSIAHCSRFSLPLTNSYPSRLQKRRVTIFKIFRRNHSFIPN